MCRAHCALPNCEIRNTMSPPPIFQALKTTMSMSREDVEKPARIPAVATVSPVGCINGFEQFIQPVFLRLARADEIDTRNIDKEQRQGTERPRCNNI